MADADLLAEIAALRAELAAQQRTIPALPSENDGQAIRWQPWRQAPEILAHVDLACAQCAHPGPPLIAFGLVEERRPVIRYQASRCPACQEMTVYRRDHPKYGMPGTRLVEIAYHPPQTPPASTNEETNPHA
ncbi:hypothetical protein [Microbispora rosea]|uniref:hypothetical protein n=1 Tax=Microbispora rosea TaxID=58117 RepID=UPI0004C38050|nr:hypothetical protein [Microbispora rosea]